MLLESLLSVEDLGFRGRRAVACSAAGGVVPSQRLRERSRAEEPHLQRVRRAIDRERAVKDTAARRDATRVLHIGPLGRLHCSGSRSCWRAPTPPQVVVILDKSAGASGGSAAQPSRTPSAAATAPSRRETAAAVPSTPRRARARSRGGRARATRAGAGSVRASPLAPTLSCGVWVCGVVLSIACARRPWGVGPWLWLSSLPACLARRAVIFLRALAEHRVVEQRWTLPPGGLSFNTSDDDS